MKPITLLTIATLVTVAILLLLGPSEAAYTALLEDGTEPPEQLPRDLIAMGLVVLAGVVAWVARRGEAEPSPSSALPRRKSSSPKGIERESSPTAELPLPRMARGSDTSADAGAAPGRSA